MDKMTGFSILETLSPAIGEKTAQQQHSHQHGFRARSKQPIPCEVGACMHARAGPSRHGWNRRTAWMMPLELPLGQTKNPASDKLFLHHVAPKEMHCSCTARKSNGDVRATPIMNRRGRKRRQPGSISRQRSPKSNCRAKVAIRFVDPARQLIPPNQKEAVVCHIGGFVVCKEIFRLGHETSRAVKRSGCDFECSSRTGQVVQTIRCCRGHQV